MACDAIRGCGVKRAWPRVPRLQHGAFGIRGAHSPGWRARCVRVIALAAWASSSSGGGGQVCAAAGFSLHVGARRRRRPVLGSWAEINIEELFRCESGKMVLAGAHYKQPHEKNPARAFWHVMKRSAILLKTYRKLWEGPEVYKRKRIFKYSCRGRYRKQKWRAGA